jgi:DNA-binding transcriptional ArsR family regulator
MARTPQADIAILERKACEAAGLLRLIGNENRLLILCRLIAEKEMSVGDIADAVGLSQSALSQHLARMRAQKVVAARREGQAIFYRIADSGARRIVQLLKEIYCP